jgi:hypothetical protein
MSNNPYETPQSSSLQVSSLAGEKAPTLLTVLLVGCLILGVFGVLGACMSGVGTALNSVMQGQQFNQNADDAALEFQKKIDVMNEDMKIPNLIFVALNFIIAPILMTGSIGCLVRKPWAYSLLRFGLIAATLFVAVRAVFTLFAQWRMKDVIGDGMKDAMKDVPNPEVFSSLMGGFFWVMVVMSLLWTMFLIAYYVWCYLYLGKPVPRQYLRVE